MRLLRRWTVGKGRVAGRSGQSVVEFSLVVAVLVIGGLVSFSFVKESFVALHEARQSSLKSSVSALAMTATPNPLATATATPTVGPTRTPFPTPTATVEPTATATSTPLPTLTPTSLPLPTATVAVPTPTVLATENGTPTLPSCDDVPFYYAWFGWCE